MEKPTELLGLANIAVLCIHGPKSYGVIRAYVPIGSRLISMFNETSWVELQNIVERRTPGQSVQVGFKVSQVEAKVQGFAQKQCQVCSRGTKQMQRVCFSQFSKNHNLNCRGLWAKMGKVLKLHLFCSVQVGHPQGLALMSLTKKTEFSSWSNQAVRSGFRMSKGPMLALRTPMCAP